MLSMLSQNLLYEYFLKSSFLFPPHPFFHKSTYLRTSKNAKCLQNNDNSLFILTFEPIAHASAQEHQLPPAAAALLPAFLCSAVRVTPSRPRHMLVSVSILLLLLLPLLLRPPLL
jgi:hypothetical protein